MNQKQYYKEAGSLLQILLMWILVLKNKSVKEWYWEDFKLKLLKKYYTNDVLFQDLGMFISFML